MDQITKIFSHPIRSVHVHENGDDFVMLEVNREWMFRFPRNTAARQALQCEKRFLPEFEKVFPLPIPHIQYVGENFTGYRKIKGSLLTPSLMKSLSKETRDKIAGQIGEFLSALHAFPLDQALQMGLTEGWNGWRIKAYRRFRESVAPCLRPGSRENALAYLEQFFAMDWKRVVIHGDFYPRDHLFFDKKRQELCGVIDFGDLTIEDAATDFQSLLEDFGTGFLQAVLARYSGRLDEQFQERIRMRIIAGPLFDASYALEYGFEGRFKSCLAEIEAAFG